MGSRYGVPAAGLVLASVSHFAHSLSGSIPFGLFTFDTTLQALEEVKLREMAIIDLQKKIGEAETKFKQQQNVYEAVRVDRNMYRYVGT